MNLPERSSLQKYAFSWALELRKIEIGAAEESDIVCILKDEFRAAFWFEEPETVTERNTEKIVHDRDSRKCQGWFEHHSIDSSLRSNLMLDFNYKHLALMLGEGTSSCL